MTCLSNGREASLNLRVLATPLVYDGERYTLLAVEKVSYQQPALAQPQPEAARVEAQAQA
jgi:hypothetical protein